MAIGLERWGECVPRFGEQGRRYSGEDRRPSLYAEKDVDRSSMTNKPSRWLSTLRSILIGFAFFVLGSVSEVWLQHHTYSRTTAMISDALLGVLVGLVVLSYERRQQRNIIRKLEVIRLMNHHVRNSLQVISFAASVPQQEALEADIRNAVDRIEWALREVLPGQRQDVENLLFDRQVSAEKVKTVA
jgi:uncharacterized membrane protein